jgi:hypothetical protein
MIKFKLKYKLNLSVYIYRGKNRESALKPIVFGNRQAEVGVEYNAPISEGMLVVVFPSTANVETDLDFDYWIDDVTLAERD